MIMGISLSAIAEETILLRHYDTQSRLIHYNDSSIVAQAARFQTPAPGTIHTITMRLGGRNSRGTARLRIYGGEAGLNAPFLEKDLITPITITKTRAGAESVTITLPDPVHITSSQFFVAVDNLDANVVLLSDDIERKSLCDGKSGSYYHQLLKKRDNQWQWGRHAYAIEVGIVYDKLDRSGLVNVTAKAGLPDSMSSNGGISWGDYNDDGFLDILAGGRLYRNKGDGTFKDVTPTNILGTLPKAQCFIDIDNDTDADILFIGCKYPGDSVAVLFRNNDNADFIREEIPFPSIKHPSGLSLADVNGDGYLDIFLGQTGFLNTPRNNVLLLNTRGTGFSIGLDLNEYNRLACGGSQWVDYNSDGYSDLFIAGADTTAGRILAGDGKGGLARIAVTSGLDKTLRVSGCSWADYDNDGDMDLLLPTWGQVGLLRKGMLEPIGDIATHEADPGMLKWKAEQRVNDFMEYRSGGSWADVNNDGLLDYLLASSCPCVPVDLFIQSSGGAFERRTAEYGLHGISGGEDAAWADYDNDGRIDLAIMQGSLQLYRNQGITAEAHYVALDLENPAGNAQGIGARVTVHAGDRKYTRDVTSGRGLLMQDPLRLHIGIGEADAVDSVIVRWPGSGTTPEVFTDLKIDAVNHLKSGQASGAGGTGVVRLDAHPNPFSTELNITYSVPIEGPVRLAIYSMTGEEIALLVNRRQHPGDYSVVWNGRDAAERPLSQGTYIYRLTAGDADVHGRVVLAR